MYIDILMYIYIHIYSYNHPGVDGSFSTNPQASGQLGAASGDLAAPYIAWRDFIGISLCFWGLDGDFMGFKWILHDLTVIYRNFMGLHGDLE
jgi:hypothetical protein